MTIAQYAELHTRLAELEKVVLALQTQLRDLQSLPIPVKRETLRIRRVDESRPARL